MPYFAPMRHPSLRHLLVLTLLSLAAWSVAAPGKIGGHVPPKIRGDQAEWLRRRMASGPFTLRGLVAELAERGLKVDDHTMWDFAHAEGLSFKKNRTRQ